MKTYPKVCRLILTHIPPTTPTTPFPLLRPACLNFASSRVERARWGGGELGGVSEGAGRIPPGPCPLRRVTSRPGCAEAGIPLPPARRCSPQRSLKPRRCRGAAQPSAGRLESLDRQVKEQPDARGSSAFGTGLLHASATTCLESLPAPDRDGEGARWVSPTSCCTVLRLACLQIHQIIHAKQPFRNHFLCFLETLLYSSICLI